jgi:putative transposase
MKRSRYTEEQIIGILKEVEAGLKVAEVCRKYGLSSWTVYAWRKKYQGMSVSEANKLKALEEENRRLKQLVANLSLDNAALKDVLSKNW